MGKAIFALSLVIGLPLIFIGIYFIGYGLVGFTDGIGFEVITVGSLGLIAGVIILVAGKRTMRPKVRSINV